MRIWSIVAFASALASCSPAATDAGGTEASYFVYVSNEQSGDISVVDPIARKEIERIPIGKRPRGLVVSPDGNLLYVAVSGSPIAGPGVDETKLPPADKAADGIAVIDLETRRLVHTLRGISDPEQIAISPDGERLFVASEDTSQLIIIARDGRILQKLAVGEEPEGVAVSADGLFVMVTSEQDHSISLIRNGVVPTIDGKIEVGLRPRNAAFLPDGRAAVPGENDASVSIVDLRALKRMRTIQLPKSDRPMGLVVSRAGLLFVTTGRGKRLVRIDPREAARENPVTGALEVGSRPWGVVLSPDARFAFTANGPDNDITVSSLSKMAIIGRVRVGTGPWGIAIGPNKP